MLAFCAFKQGKWTVCDEYIEEYDEKDNHSKIDLPQRIFPKSFGNFLKEVRRIFILRKISEQEIILMIVFSFCGPFHKALFNILMILFKY